MQTYVVRLWTPHAEADQATDALRGVLEHLPSGRSEPFRSDAELLRLLRSGTREHDGVGQGSGEAS